MVHPLYEVFQYPALGIRAYLDAPSLGLQWQGRPRLLHRSTANVKYQRGNANMFSHTSDLEGTFKVKVPLLQLVQWMRVATGSPPTGALV